MKLSYQLWGAAPVQAIGVIGDREFYFRARHDEWSFEVAHHDGSLGSDTGRRSEFERSGHYKNASFIQANDAKQIIADCASAYAKMRGAMVTETHVDERS